MMVDDVQKSLAGMAKLVDASDLGSGSLVLWGFNSLYPHIPLPLWARRERVVVT